jgi:hypothetical protein
VAKWEARPAAQPSLGGTTVMQAQNADAERRRGNADAGTQTRERRRGNADAGTQTRERTRAQGGVEKEAER